MDSLKTIFIIAILAAVAGGVYVSINKDRQETMSTEEAEGWPSGPPTVEFGSQSEAPPFSFGAPGEGTMPGPPPDMSISSTVASVGAAGPYANRAPGIEDPLGGQSISGPESQARVPTQGMPSGGPAPSFDRTSDVGMAAQHGLPPAIGQVGSIPNSGPGMTGPSISAGRSPGFGPAAASQAGRPFAEFIAESKERLNRGEFVEVYKELDARHGEGGLNADEDRQLTELLDQVAGTVVYSTGHFLEPAYRVRPGDTLDAIAETYKVTPQLLAKINSISDPLSLEPGKELKVVRGPFDAHIDLDKLELTLRLQGCYAGRFTIGTGNDHPQLAGSHTVRAKMLGPTYYGRDETIAGDDPKNPLGKHWIGLDNRIGIHGTNDQRNVGATSQQGAICLGDRDIDDVFDILTIGSRVVVRR
jgi:LysM repeat protein